MHDLTLDSTVANLINAKLSNKDAWELIRSQGEEFSINGIPFIYEAAGFIPVNLRKRLFETNEHTSYTMTIKEALPMARKLRNEQKKLLGSQDANKASKPPYAAVVDANTELDSNELKTLNPLENDVKQADQTESVPPTNNAVQEVDSIQLQTLNLPSIEQAEQIQPLVLAALGLNSIQLDKLKELLNEAGNESFGFVDEDETIYSAIGKLSGRNRKNKTYYISDDLIERISQFSEAHTIKPSAFVEVAVIDALKRYSKK